MRIVDYGAFAEIEPGVEGLLHVSQLSRSQVENAGEVVNEGETHLLRIVSIDSQRQRIGLSLRQVSASEQIEWMALREAEAEAEAGNQEDANDEETAELDETVSSEVVAEADEIEDEASAESDADGAAESEDNETETEEEEES